VSAAARDDWLLAQLPEAMGHDRVIAGFVRGCQEVVDSVRARLDSLEYDLDVDFAAPDMLTFLASWLGITTDPVATSDPAGREAQRRLIRAVGQVLPWRGTRRGLETLLEALTGGRVDVSDSGGVFGRDDPLPTGDGVVRVTLAHTGGLTQRQVLAVIADELPVGATVELHVRAGKEAG
jgi:phage tail-like protein